jgi:hypothetical protein
VRGEVTRESIGPTAQVVPPSNGKSNTEAYTEGRRETDAVIGRGNIEWRVVRIRPRTP